MRKKKGDKNGARPTLNEDLGSPLRGPDFRSKSKPSLHSSPYRMWNINYQLKSAIPMISASQMNTMKIAYGDEKQSLIMYENTNTCIWPTCTMHFDFGKFSANEAAILSPLNQSGCFVEQLCFYSNKRDYLDQVPIWLNSMPNWFQEANR